MLRTPAIRYSILMLAFLSVFTLTMPVLLAAFATQVFDLGASGYGLFNSLVAIGARRRRARLDAAGRASGCASSSSAAPVWAAVLARRRGHADRADVRRRARRLRHRQPVLLPVRQPARAAEHAAGGARPRHLGLGARGARRAGHRRPDHGRDRRPPRRARRHAHRRRRPRDRGHRALGAARPARARCASRSPPTARWSPSPPADSPWIRGSAAPRADPRIHGAS